MPKKFHGENTKAVEARARKQSQKEEEKTRKEKEAEDAYWRDDDKLVNRRLQRREEREKKQQEKVDRKLENKAMHEAEMEKVAGSKAGATGGASNKVTQAEIASLQERQQKDRERELERQRLDAQKISIQGGQIEENINRMQIEGQQARTIEQAISVLSDDNDTVDRNPEKRMKAAYAAFEEKNLPRVKAENPNLRLSQLKQMLKKEWMKSPENPMVQKTFAAVEAEGGSDESD